MTKLMALTLACGAVAACHKDTKKSEPATQARPAGPDQPAPPAEPKPVTPPTAATSAPAGNYQIDLVHSALIWRAQHFGAGYTYGWFRDFGGTFVVDPDPAKQHIELTVQVGSIDSRDPKRDDDLKGPDFFNAAQFPTITFKSTKVEAAGPGFKVTGDLTIHGVTKSVTADVAATGNGVDPWKNIRAGYETKLTINRMDFGVAFMPEGVGRAIELTIAFEGVKK